MSRLLNRTAFSLSLVALCALPVAAQTQTPGTMPNGARAPAGSSPTAPTPGGTSTGLPDANSSTPIGTPAAPAEIIGRPVMPRSTPTPETQPGSGNPASMTPPATSQSPMSRSQPPTRMQPQALPRSPSRRGSTTRDLANEATPNSGFPSGLSDCVANPDRAARARCASDLYGPAGSSR